MADWPNGANVLWGGKSERILNPVTISRKDNPIGTRKVKVKNKKHYLMTPEEEEKKYHATFVCSFSLDKVVSLKEATNILLRDNNKLTINYYTRGENGLPSTSATQEPWEFEWNPDHYWQYADGTPLRPYPLP